MKGLIFSMAVTAVLAACGGGGATVSGSSGDTAAQKPTVTCTYPTAVKATTEQIAGNVGTHTITDTTQRLKINISGDTNTVELGQCVYVESLTISGDTNTVKTDETSRIDSVRFEVNTRVNNIWVPASTNVTVTDLGNINSVKRY